MKRLEAHQSRLDAARNNTKHIQSLPQVDLVKLIQADAGRKFLDRILGHKYHHGSGPYLPITAEIRNKK